MQAVLQYVDCLGQMYLLRVNKQLEEGSVYLKIVNMKMNQHKVMRARKYGSIADGQEFRFNFKCDKHLKIGNCYYIIYIL